MTPYLLKTMTSVVEVFHGQAGAGLRAALSLPPGTVVARFEGPVMPWEQVPPEEARHALLLENGLWLVDRGLARLVNHACRPNCRVNGANEIVTSCRVAAGQELTIAYNVVYEGEDPGPWDPRWSFDCACKSDNCRGRVDGYVTPEGRPYGGACA